MASIREELKRRNVAKVTMAYPGVGEEELALDYLVKSSDDPYVKEFFTLYTNVVLTYLW